MNTVRLNKEAVDQIVSLLIEGGKVAIPTDTVYGLAIRSDQAVLYDDLKKTKGRPDSKPFPLMVGSIEQLDMLVEMDALTRYLVHAFMPGAVTFIFNKKAEVFPFLGTQTTLGIRMADDPWVQSLIVKLGVPIWLPSANLSGEETALNADMVLTQLDGLIEGVVLGEAQGKASSSVFDLTTPEIVQYREGPVSLEEIVEAKKKYLENKAKYDNIIEE